MIRARRPAPAWAAEPRLVGGAILILLALAPVLTQALGQPFMLRVLTRILIFGIAAASLNLVLGYGGMVSLGQAMFLGAASYIVGIMAWHSANAEPILTWPITLSGSTNALIAWPLAVLASALLGLAIGAVALRTSGLYFIMITLALAQMGYYFAVSLEKYGGDDGLRLRGRSHLPGIDLSSPTLFYYLVLLAAGGSAFLVSRLVNSRFGLLIQASSQNETRIAAVGVETYPYRLACLAISGAFAGVAGVLMVNLESFVSPSDLSLGRSSELVAMVLLGGVGTLHGPYLGAFFYIAAQLLLSNVTTHWPLIFGPLLILVVMSAPRGLAGWFERHPLKEGAM